MTRHLLSFEKALVRQQHIGAFFSGEFTKHIHQKAAVCRYCGEIDSRLHRLRWWQRTAAWRTVFPSLFRLWDNLPEFTTAFGLFPEPEGWREWQAALDSLLLPEITTSDSRDCAVFYTDGACLFPRHPVIRIASGAVLRADENGTFQVCWHGVLPWLVSIHFPCRALGGFVCGRYGQETYGFHGFSIGLSYGQIVS